MFSIRKKSETICWIVLERSWKNLEVPGCFILERIWRNLRKNLKESQEEPEGILGPMVFYFRETPVGIFGSTVSFSRNVGFPCGLLKKKLKEFWDPWYFSFQKCLKEPWSSKCFILEKNKGFWDPWCFFWKSSRDS